jgi:DNA-binding NarL/FixJ family response regulator
MMSEARAEEFSGPSLARRVHGNGTRLMEPSSKTRVLLVDDHVPFRQGLHTVLDYYADLAVVGEASDGQEALACVERLRPSIVVMDINMPRMNGIEATEQIKRRFPDTVVIGLSVYATHDNAEAMLNAGAATLVMKESAMDELYPAIQKVL